MKLLVSIKKILSHPHVLPLLIGFSLILFRFAPMFFGMTLLFGDNFSLMVPGKLFTITWLGKGILPLWNPLLFAGIPWVGDINQSIFYPSTLLFFLKSPGWALNITILAHQVFTLMGAYILCWRFTKKRWPALIGALIWTFAPQMTGALNNISTLQSLSWVPWVALSGLGVGRKKWFLVVFPIVATFQLLAGYPQHVLYSVLTAVALNAWVSRRKLNTFGTFFHWMGTWAIVGLLTLLLTSFLWLPFLSVMEQSTRSIQSLKQGATGSLHPEDLLKIISPYLFDQPSAGMRWGPSWNRMPNLFLYVTWVGIGMLGISILRKKFQQTDWFLLIVITLCILYAFGSYIPGFTFIQQLPLLRQSRGISTILMIPALLLSVLVARAFCANQEWVQKQSRLKFVMIGLGSLAVGSAIGWFVAANFFTPIWNEANTILGGALAASSFHTLARDQVIARLFFQNLFIVLLSTMLALFFLHRRQYLIMTVVVGIELLYFTSAFFHFGSINVYTLAEQFTASSLLQNTDLRSYRVLTRNYNAPYSDFGSYNDAITVRAPFSDSYVDRNELKNFTVMQQMRDGITPDWNIAANVPVIHGYTTLLPLSLHEVFWDQTNDPWINNLPQIPTSHSGLTTWATKYYLVDTWFPDYGEKFPEKILGESSNLKLYEIPNVLSRFRFADDQSVVMEDFSEQPNVIKFSTTNSNNQPTLIVADRYDKDWHVSINGEEITLENYQGMRRFAVPEGQFAVKMWYEPIAFYRGLVISAVTLLIMIGYVLFQYLRDRQKGSHRTSS